MKRQIRDLVKKWFSNFDVYKNHLEALLKHRRKDLSVEKKKKRRGNRKTTNIGELLFLSSLKLTQPCSEHLKHLMEWQLFYPVEFSSWNYTAKHFKNNIICESAKENA